MKKLILDHVLNLFHSQILLNHLVLDDMAEICWSWNSIVESKMMQQLQSENQQLK